MASEYYDGYGGIEDFMPEPINYGKLNADAALHNALTQALAINQWGRIAAEKSAGDRGLELLEQKGENALSAANQNVKNAALGSALDIGAALIGGIPFGGGGGGPGFGYDDVVYGKISDPTADIQRALGPNTEFKMYPGSFISN